MLGLTERTGTKEPDPTPAPVSRALGTVVGPGVPEIEVFPLAFESTG
jgi:hypothetical protein